MNKRDVPVVQLPEQVIEALRQLLNDGERYQWAVGDLITDVLAEFPDVKRAELIRQLADRTGADRSTLRDRHNVARFYPIEVRKQYDMLTWSQLRACKSAGTEWRQYADWAAGHMPAPVAVLRARIKHNGHDMPAWVHRWESMQGIARQLVNDTDAPKRARRIAGIVDRQVLDT